MSPKGTSSAPGLAIAAGPTQGTRATTRTIRAGGGAGGGIQQDPIADLSEWQPGGNDVWDHAKAAHLLRRAGFGGKPEEVDAVVKLGMNRTVDLLLTQSRYGLQELGGQLLPHGEPLNLSYDVASQRAQWLYEATHSLYPLKEKMALFWHDHFSVGVENIRGLPLMIAHINVFRRHGLGRFGDLLRAVTVDPAMLEWLDNRINGRISRQTRKPEINENYGRELLELYTLGVDGPYTENDVQEASKALTGWTSNGYNYSFYNGNLHIPGRKTVLGRSFANTDGRDDLTSLIGILLAEKKTGEFVAGKVWAYFVSPKPYPALIAELGRRWAQDGYDIRALMSTILRSRYFYSADSIRQLVKNPVEFAVGALRNLGAPTLQRYRILGARIDAMGYPLLRYSNPAGLDDGIAWLSSQALVARANFANELTQTNTRAGIASHFNPAREIVRAGLKTDVEVVDHYLKILVDGRVPASVRSNLIYFMNHVDAGYSRFDVTDPAKVNVKVRGLVHLILSLPEYQMN